MAENIRTGLRVLICGVFLWSLQLGSYSVPISFGAAVLVGTLLAVLVGYEFAIRDAPPRLFVAVAAGLLAMVLGSYFVWSALQPPRPTGPLRPAREPTPKLSCPAQPDPGDLVIVFGPDARIGQGRGPFTSFGIADCSGPTFTRGARGLSFSEVGYDYDGDVAFVIRDGIYRPLLPLPLRVVRPDPSTYILLDHYNQEVLYIRYLNPNAVRVRGRFICGEAPQAVVRDDAILQGGTRLSGIYRGQRLVPGHSCLKAGPQNMPKLSRRWP